MTKAAWPVMLEQGYGRIINTTSAAGIYGNFGPANYAFAKRGLIGFTNTLALEGARKGIVANVTPLVVRLCSEESEENGSLFEVGALFDPKAVLTAEAIDAAWDKIGNFTDAQHPTCIQDTFTPVFANLGIRM